MKVLRRFAWAFGVVALGFASGSASAAPLTFTWSPSSASPALVGGDIVGANNIVITDFADIIVNTTTGAFTENGDLLIGSFQNLGPPQTTVTSTGLNQNVFTTSGSATPGGYSLYVTFTATGTQGLPLPAAPNSVGGLFSTLTYTLFATPNPGALMTSPTAPGFTVTPGGGVTITSSGGTPFALATGSLIFGTTNIQNTGAPGQPFQPSAHIQTTINPALGQNGFFVIPSALQIALDILNGAFTADPTVTTITMSCTDSSHLCIDISGGGGNITFLAQTVPEPSALALFGSALLGLYLFGWKRKTRS